MLVLDRFEEGFAVCEYNGEYICVPTSMLSPDVKEGDVLRLNGDIYEIDVEMTNIKREKNSYLLDSLWE